MTFNNAEHTTSNITNCICEAAFKLDWNVSFVSETSFIAYSKSSFNPKFF
jgi:hypothetical protein